MKRYICLVLYYGFARYLPHSSSRFGGISKKIRYLLCKNIFKHCGVNVIVERLAWFGTGRDIEIEDYSGIGINAKVYNNVKIGKNVMMGPNCFMLESTHLYSRVDIPMREQGRKMYRDKVIIGDDVWIGRDVLIIGSKEIKTGSIIGARCVLSKNFPDYSIVGGNPARLIRSRK